MQAQVSKTACYLQLRLSSCTLQQQKVNNMG
jgi:hypothetical protein